MYGIEHHSNGVFDEKITHSRPRYSGGRRYAASTDTQPIQLVQLSGCCFTFNLPHRVARGQITGVSKEFHCRGGETSISHTALFFAHHRAATALLVRARCTFANNFCRGGFRRFRLMRARERRRKKPPQRVPAAERARERRDGSNLKEREESSRHTAPAPLYFGSPSSLSLTRSLTRSLASLLCGVLFFYGAKNSLIALGLNALTCYLYIIWLVLYHLSHSLCAVARRHYIITIIKKVIPFIIITIMRYVALCHIYNDGILLRNLQSNARLVRCQKWKYLAVNVSAAVCMWICMCNAIYSWSCMCRTPILIFFFCRVPFHCVCFWLRNIYVPSTACTRGSAAAIFDLWLWEQGAG
jgi:hypothetical protein